VTFWDSSAVGPLLVEHAASSGAAAWLADDDGPALSTLTPVDIVSALRRLVRERAIGEDLARLAVAAEREGFDVPS
jgi:predicted nucleic acid-binding protein